MRASAAGAAGAGASHGGRGRNHRRRYGRQRAGRGPVRRYRVISHSRRLLTWPEWPFLKYRALAVVAPAAVAVEKQIIAGGADAAQDLPARRRDHRREQHRRETDRFRGVEQDLREPIGRCRILCQCPGRGCRDELVGAIDQPKRGRRTLVQRKAVHRGPIVGHHALSQPRQLIVAGRAWRHAPAAVAMRHRRDPADQIAQVVREIDVVALLVPLPREVAVAAEGDLLHEIQPERVDAEPIRRLDRIDDGAERLAHALAVHRHEAVAEDLPRQRQLRGHQHRRPDHGVKPRDVLADDVQVGRPPLLEHLRVVAESDRRRVVDQGIEPDVDHARRIPRQRNAPRLPRAADRNILQAAFDQPQDFVAPDVGLEELRVRGEVIEQRLLVLRQPEEVVLFADPLRLERRDAADSCR